MNDKNKNDGLAGFDEQLQGDESSKDQMANGLEHQWNDAVKNTTDSAKNHIKKKLMNKMTSSSSSSGGGHHKSNGLFAANVGSKVTKAKSKLGAKLQGAKAGMKGAMKTFLGFLKLIGKALAVIISQFGWALLAMFIVIVVVSFFSGLVINREYSRTADASYQQIHTTDTNTVMTNNIASQGNVFFNPDTHRYELGKNKAPTEANKLYYMYYAVMSEESRWYVLYERDFHKYQPGQNGTIDSGNEDKGAGTENEPYWKPMDFNPLSHAGKETLDGRLFNATNVQDIANDPTDPFHMDKYKNQINKEDDLFDDTTLKAVRKLSLDANTLYLLDSTLHGSMLGTGKDQMFYAEQFVKPVAYDKNYNFKALTKYKDMTNAEVQLYGSKARGDYTGSGKSKKYIDGTYEKKFQTKYNEWTTLLDAQNKARGGSDGTTDDSNSSGASAAGINNPILAKAFAWGLQHVGKGITYSMGNRLGPNSYDCSGFVSSALDAAGMKGVKGLNTVGMLTHSNAMGQHGKDFKQVDLQHAKKGDIVVTGGLGGAGAAGHVFFLAEDYHGGDTKVLECTAADGDHKSPNGGVFDTRPFKWAGCDGQPVALEPANNGGDSSSSSSDSASPTNSQSSHTKKDMSMETPSVYGNKMDTGELVAASRVFDPKYHPTIVNNLAIKEQMKYKMWSKGDFFVDTEIDGVNWEKIANHTGNTLFDPNSGAIQPDKNKRPKSASGRDYLYGYTDDRAELVKWCLQNGYNPAFMISLIYSLSNYGEHDFEGTKYNFLNQDIVEPGDGSDSSSQASSQSSSSSKKDDKKQKSSSQSSAASSSVDLSGANTQYGARYYNHSYKIKSMSDGLNALKEFFDNKDNKGKSWNEVEKSILTNGRQRRMFDDAYQSLSGSQTVSMKLSNTKQASDAASNNFYTYDTDPDKSQDPTNLAVITDAKAPDNNGNGKPLDKDHNCIPNVEKQDGTNETTIRGQKFYYEKTTWVKQAPAAVTGSALSSKHKYAIERIDANECGKQELKDYCYYYNVDCSDKDSESTLRQKVKANLTAHPDQNAQTERGVWDYGLGSIIKLDDSQYYVWGIVEKNGTYYRVSVPDPTNNKTPNNRSYYDGVDLRHVDPQLKFSILGVTTPVGTINVGNDSAEDTDKVLHAISQLPVLNSQDDFKKANVTKQSNDIKTILDGHKLDTSNNDMSLAISKMGTGNLKPDFYVTDKPNLSNQSYKMTDMAGADYIRDYLENYETYVPNTVGTKIDVVQRWKKMSYHSNSDDQTATDRVIGIINSLLKEGKKQQPKQDTDNTQAAAGASGGAKYWEDQIRKVAKDCGQTVNDTDVAKISSMMKAESGYNETVVQKIQDCNSRAGHPARGILQFVPSTFNAYAVPGHTNINSGIDQIYALFNDSNWQHDIHYGGGWGPTGSPRTKGGGANAQDANSSDSSNGGSSSSGQKTSSTGMWGDFFGGLKALFTRYFYTFRFTLNKIFSDSGSAGFNPTMFAEYDTFNDKAMVVVKNNKPVKVYPKGSLVVNGADAYTWRQIKNPLSQTNTNMVLRQIAAIEESRDCRPVYYDEIWDHFNTYDIGRIYEENTKENVIEAFKASGGQNVIDPSGNQQQNKQNKVSPDVPLSKGGDLKKMTVTRNYGWYKDGDKVKFSSGMIIKGDPGAPINALKAGRVELAQDNCVIIRSDNNSEMIAYVTLGKVNVKEGQQVQAGDQIGTLDNTGKFKLMDLDSNYKVYGDDGKTPQIPTGKPTDKGNGYTGCYDPATLFTDNESNITKAVEQTNGYDPTKYGANHKPSSSDFKKTKNGTLGDLLK